MNDSIERLLEAWDGDTEDLIALLQLLGRTRSRGIAFAEARAHSELTILQDEVAQLRIALLYVANNDRWEGVPRLREFALQALGEQE